ncbi:hypothetical protein XF_1266 [Xylella fastidiosa 9a5c]|uniref:Uncharacterized protein n=1 Tax=Xylella fastidiosa (strain 9a5c) TaxID=160492 RepID=Q9PDW3_XYLFA|nr:hypothetical protein XF_1266 [Xylella fastidiosa 9a5c]
MFTVLLASEAECEAVLGCLVRWPHQQRALIVLDVAE